MSRIFFYGLFMDQSLLEKMGLRPKIIGRAVLPDFCIHIGKRATLLPSVSCCAYGIVMELADEEVSALYADPSVQEYRPEQVEIELLDNHKAIDVLCYNLPPELGLAGTNAAYATELVRLAEALDFDPAYIEEIAAFGEVS